MRTKTPTGTQAGSLTVGDPKRDGWSEYDALSNATPKTGENRKYTDTKIRKEEEEEKEGIKTESAFRFPTVGPRAKKRSQLAACPMAGRISSPAASLIHGVERRKVPGKSTPPSLEVFESAVEGGGRLGRVPRGPLQPRGCPLARQVKGDAAKILPKRPG